MSKCIVFADKFSVFESSSHYSSQDKLAHSNSNCHQTTNYSGHFGRRIFRENTVLLKIWKPIKGLIAKIATDANICRRYSYSYLPRKSKTIWTGTKQASKHYITKVSKSWKNRNRKFHHNTFFFMPGHARPERTKTYMPKERRASITNNNTQPRPLEEYLFYCQLTDAKLERKRTALTTNTTNLIHSIQQPYRSVPSTPPLWSGGQFDQPHLPIHCHAGIPFPLSQAPTFKDPCGCHGLHRLLPPPPGHFSIWCKKPSTSIKNNISNTVQPPG